MVSPCKKCVCRIGNSCVADFNVIGKGLPKIRDIKGAGIFPKAYDVSLVESCPARENAVKYLRNLVEDPLILERFHPSDKLTLEHIQSLVKIRNENKIAESNRIVAGDITIFVRKRMGVNAVLVRLPWDETSPPPIDQRWNKGIIVSCDEIPTNIGSVSFCIKLNGKVSCSDPIVTNQRELQTIVLREQGKAITELSKKRSLKRDESPVSIDKYAISL